MLLKNLIKNSPKSLEKLKIKGLALNSKDVKKGFIFFAVKGNQSNGESYINDAIKNGSIIIICSKSCKFKSTKVNVIKTNKVRKYLSEITSKFYKLKPKNIEQLAAVLAIIRPAKRHLVDSDWAKIEQEVWQKPLDNSYFFKKAHAFGYAHAIVLQMNLLVDLTN